MYDLKELEKEIGKAVAMTVFDTPFCFSLAKDNKILIIKRPSDDEWKPNKYSVPTGHVEETDLIIFKEWPIKQKEWLYVLAGLRELSEELKTKACASFLRYVGSYHDDETNYDVIVLMGYMQSSGIEKIEDVRIKKPKVSGSKEAAKVYWKSLKEVEELIEKNKFAGERVIEMCLQELYSRR